MPRTGRDVVRPGEFVSVRVDLVPANDTGPPTIAQCGESTFPAEPFPPFLQRLIAAGGLVPYVRDRLTGERRPAPQ